MGISHPRSGIWNNQFCILISPIFRVFIWSQTTIRDTNLFKYSNWYAKQRNHENFVKRLKRLNSIRNFVLHRIESFSWTGDEITKYKYRWTVTLRRLLLNTRQIIINYEICEGSFTYGKKWYKSKLKRVHYKMFIILHLLEFTKTHETFDSRDLQRWNFGFMPPLPSHKQY